MKITFKNWLTIIGASILFTSWILERIDIAKQARIDDLKRSQLVIDIMEANRTTAEIEYYRIIRNKSIDSSQLASVEINLATTYMNLVNYNRGRLAGTDSNKLKLYQTDLQQKYLLDSINNRAFQAKRYWYVDGIFKKVCDVFKAQYLPLDNQFNTVYHDEDNDQHNSSNEFTFSYIIGSLFLGLAYLVGLKKNQG